jgi:hypothetical protein
MEHRRRRGVGPRKNALRSRRFFGRSLPDVTPENRGRSLAREPESCECHRLASRKAVVKGHRPTDRRGDDIRGDTGRAAGDLKAELVGYFRYHVRLWPIL